MMITNILQTTNLEEQQKYIDEKYIGSDDFLHLRQSKTGCEIRT